VWVLKVRLLGSQSALARSVVWTEAVESVCDVLWPHLLLVVVLQGEGKAMVVHFMGSQSALARGIVWLNVVVAAALQQP